MSEEKNSVILLGNHAIAHGAFEAGVKFASGYPGTPSTEILERFALFPNIHAEWSPNEKSALEAALGASYSGYRALSTMKHVGLNVASDPFVTAVYTGVTGGLVVVTADDPGMHSSQNEQDNRYYARLSHAPMFEPAEPEEAYRMIKDAYKISEKFDVPVLFRITTRISHSSSSMILEGERLEIEYPLNRSSEKFVMVPSNARVRKKSLLDRKKALSAYSNESEWNKIERGIDELGIITSSVSYLYVKEAFEQASILKLGFSYPLPKDLISSFAREMQAILVVEELDPVLETEIKAMGINVHGKDVLPEKGELNPEIVSDAIAEVLKSYRQKTYSLNITSTKEKVSNLPKRPPVLCPGCGHRNLFYVLKKLRSLVTGDIGCYTLAANPPLSSMDTCVCMGASIGEAHGISKALENAGKEKNKVVAVIGDSTFVHSGITGLVNAVYNRSNILVVILDNRTTAMTGHQPHPGTGTTITGEKTTELDFSKLARSIGVEFVETVDPYDLKNTEKVLRKAFDHYGVSVVIARRPCVLYERPKTKPYYVDEELCTGCWLCLRLGCPAIARKEETVEILEHLCTGCAACVQLCRFDVILPRKEDWT